MDETVALGPGVQRLLERIARSERSVVSTRQPTMRRAKTSMTKATYTKPRHVAT